MLFLLPYVRFVYLYFFVTGTHSGIDITGNTVGFAFLGTMCSETHSIGLTQDGGRNSLSTAVTASHELGHIFSMNHGNIK